MLFFGESSSDNDDCVVVGSFARKMMIGAKAMFAAPKIGFNTYYLVEASKGKKPLI